MTTKAQLIALKAALVIWGGPLGAQIDVGACISELFGMFAEGAPQGLRVKILFAGETKRGEFEEAGMVDRNFTIVMKTPKSMAREADDTKESNATRPPYDLVESLRDALRAVQFGDPDNADGTNTTEVTPDYKGTGIFQTPTQGAVDGYQLDISIGTQLPAIP